VLTLSGVATVLSISVACLPEIESHLCTAVATLSNGAAETVSAQAAWTSSNTAVATVESTGRVRHRTTGQTDIRATYRNVSGSVRLDIVVGLTGASVVINELIPRTTDGGSWEFVELRNDSSRAVDVGGWRLMTGTAKRPQDTTTYFTFPAGVTLLPGCHYLVATKDVIFGVVPDFRVSSALDGDSGIALLRGDGTIVDQVGLDANAPYKEGLPLPNFGVDDDRPYTRVGNDTNNNVFDFARQAPTPMNRASSCSVR
jgi:hypothetical protein